MSVEVITSKSRPAKAVKRPVVTLFSLFGVSFGIALATGLYYYLTPPGLNWTVSQGALIAHSLVGAVALGCFVPFVIKHQRAMEGRSLWLLAPWLALKRGRQEVNQRFRQRFIGHALTWSLAIVGISGLLVTIPAWLWLAGIVWLPGYATYTLSNLVHLAASLAAAGFLIAHLFRRRRNGRKSE
jgi:hypothetical protein